MENCGGVNQPACAACKHQRKKCSEKCALAPYFPAHKAQDFQAVHRVFGISNVLKMLNNVEESERPKMVETLIWEATCRQRDPVQGSYGVYRTILEQHELLKSQIGQFRVQAGLVCAPANGNGFNGSLRNNGGSGIGRGRGHAWSNTAGSYGHEAGSAGPRCHVYTTPYVQGAARSAAVQGKEASSSVLHSLQQQMILQPSVNHQLYLTGQYNGNGNGKTMQEEQ